MDDSINEYYKGKSVFVTGATGFVGKLLVEKLLYSCDSIERIYLLIRAKNGLDASERLNEITSCKVFDKLRKKEPFFADRLTAVQGDILDTEGNLGIFSASKSTTNTPNTTKSTNDNNEVIDAEFLKANCSVVFHLAGTARLDADLKSALLVNVCGLRNTLAFVKKFSALDAFVHVSSIYANANKSYIDEQIYEADIPPQKILNLLEWMEDDWLRIATPKLIADKPNTFTYTKWLSETLLQQEIENTDLPVVIVRPSTIGASWKEPFAGWVEKSSGPCDLFIAAGRGYLRSMKGEGHAVLDIVPVDIVVNLLISASWHKAVQKQQQQSTKIMKNDEETQEDEENDKEVEEIAVNSSANSESSNISNQQIQIYNCTTGGLHPFRWGEMESFLSTYSKNIPFEGAFRRPNMTLTSNSLMHDYWVFVTHLIPAYMSDVGLALIGRKPRVVQVYKKIHKMLGSLEYLTQVELKCNYDNVIALRNAMSPSDSDTHEFYFDPRGIHWPTYIENYLIGTKKYLLNEDLHGVPAAKQHLKTLRNIRWTTNMVCGVLIWRLLIAKSQPARNLWFLVLSLAARFVRFFRLSSTMIKQ
jgi:fatty acyl-CoA reductase